MRRIATVVLMFGVVLGFGSGFASIARHGRWACHGGANGYGPPGWGRWDRDREPEQKTAPAQPQTVVVQPQQAPAPAPVIVQQPQPAAPQPIIIVVPSQFAPAPVAPVAAPQPAVAPSNPSP